MGVMVGVMVGVTAVVGVACAAGVVGSVRLTLGAGVAAVVACVCAVEADATRAAALMRDCSAPRIMFWSMDWFLEMAWVFMPSPSARGDAA